MPLPSKSLIRIGLIVVPLILLSCNQRVGDNEFYSINLESCWDRAEDVMLSLIADEIEYIPLETSPDCLIRGPASLEVTPLENFLVVHEHNQVMRLFSRQGKFICNIGQKGQGPEEYRYISDYFVDVKTGLIYILNGNINCLIYNLEGKLQQVVNITGNPDRIIVDEDGNLGLLQLAESVLLKDSAKLTWISPEGIEKSTMPLYEGRAMGGGKLVASNVQCYWMNGSLYFAEVPFDTVYQLDQNLDFVPVWAIE